MMNNIIYIDIVLLVVLLSLSIFACGYCLFRIRRLRQDGQVTILLRPTKVLFSHKKDGQSKEELRTVVAYQNPFTGDYCVNKASGSKWYSNKASAPKVLVNRVAVPLPDSPDSGMSDEYEPLRLEPAGSPLVPPPLPHRHHNMKINERQMEEQPEYDNSMNRTWNWNYKEYQI